MKNERPKITVPYEQIDILVELMNICLLLLIWGYAIVEYAKLPDTIAIHFNAQGVADGHGNKMMLWLMPALATFIFFVMFIINKFPHVHNYMVNITEENALKNYRLSTRVLRLVNLYCLLLFAAITYEIISMSKGNESTFFVNGFIIFSLIVPILIVIVAIYYQKKINR